MDVRKLPAQESRVETGPVQFGDDWPGVFIRGDNALAYAMDLRMALMSMESGSSPSAFDIANVKELRSILTQSLARVEHG